MSERGTGILIVEDERELRDVYHDWLAPRYRVQVAATAESALERFDEDIDVALIDRDLPDRQGDTLLSDFRARNPDCRLAMLTALEQEWATLEMDFDAYLTKPIREDDINELVEALLDDDPLRLAQHDDICL